MPHWHFVGMLTCKNGKLARFRHVITQARWHVNHAGTQVHWYVEHVGRKASDLANFVLFHTPVLLRCSLQSCVHLACAFEYIFIFELPAFWTKFSRIYKREFLGVSMEVNPILDPRTWTSNILNRRGKNIHQYVQKTDKQNKNKNNKCCKMLCVDTQTKKIAKISENICILLTFTQPEHF